MRSLPKFGVSSLLVLAITSCGGNSNPGVATRIAVTFRGGTPSAAAVRTGSGTFSPASIQGGQLTLDLAAGSTTYAIAYVCDFRNPISTAHFTSAFVVEAAVQDGTAFTVSCPDSPLRVGTATGSVDASLIPGATGVNIFVDDGFAFVNSNSGSFNTFLLPAGTFDVAAVAVDASQNTLAVNFIRSQTVPGAINGGNTIIFGPSNATTNQPLTVQNVPAGFDAPSTSVVYTMNGTSIVLAHGPSTQYPAVPATASQPGDFYSYEISTADTATKSSSVGVFQKTTSGGGPVTFALPTPWSFSGPAPAAVPIFTFNYSGFAGNSGIVDGAEIEWELSPLNIFSVSVTATPAFQNGATTLAIPDLSSLPGFPVPTSGTGIFWVADIFSGAQGLDFLPSLPSVSSNGSVLFVQNQGSYTKP